MAFNISLRFYIATCTLCLRGNKFFLFPKTTDNNLWRRAGPGIIEEPTTKASKGCNPKGMIQIFITYFSLINYKHKQCHLVQQVNIILHQTALINSICNSMCRILPCLMSD